MATMTTLCFQIVTVLALFCVSGFGFKTAEDCPKYWGDIPVKLCEDTCYYFFSEEKSFHEANAVCGGRGGSLVMPRSKDVSDFLKEELATNTSDEDSSGETDKKPWVGMMKQDSRIKEPMYFWLNGERVDKDLANDVLEYGEALNIPRRNGVWQFKKTNKDDTSHFVCELTQESVNATLPPVIDNPNINVNIITTEPPVIEEVGCPKINGKDNDVKQLDDTCFYFHFEDRKSYKDAKEFCETNDGTLALIKTRKIDVFLQQHLEKGYRKPKESVWIGLHSDDDSELPTEWDDGTPLLYTNFRFTFPIFGYYTTSAENQWEAYPGEMRQHFVCQFDL